MKVSVDKNVEIVVKAIMRGKKVSVDMTMTMDYLNGQKTVSVTKQLAGDQGLKDIFNQLIEANKEELIQQAFLAANQAERVAINAGETF